MSDHISPEIAALVARGNVTVTEVAELRCNSWEWQALVPAMNDEAFLKQMQHTLDNCFTPQRRPFSTYNDAVEGLYAPELLKRFKEFSDKIGKWAEESGLDLKKFVAANPGMSRVEILVRWLQRQARAADDYAATLDAVREALGQKETHYLCIADDVKQLVEAIESRCDAVVVLKRLRGEGTRL